MYYIINYTRDNALTKEIETFCLHNANSVREAVERFEKANPQTTIIAVRERQPEEDIY